MLLTVFQEFDLDKDGYVSEEELTKICTNFNLKITKT